MKEVCLQVLRATAMMDAAQPGFEIGKTRWVMGMNSRHAVDCSARDGQVIADNGPAMPMRHYVTSGCHV